MAAVTSFLSPTMTSLSLQEVVEALEGGSNIIPVTDHDVIVVTEGGSGAGRRQEHHSRHRP